MHKDVKNLVKKLQSQGFTVRTSSKGHIIVTLNGTLVTTISGTPSDSRAIKNTEQQAKRFGFRP